ncbi:MAG: LuxR family transcriptional regulator [Alphaproteobacteria bacterium]|nr:MAG: LuxR family transcriptional regulator [Alphaproteobacteria bacterium]
MNRRLEAFIERLSAAATLDDLTDEIRALRDLFEVEHVVYHSVNSTGQQYGILTYSDAWVERYLEQDYARIDPVVQGCFRRFHPVDWKNLDWSGKAQREFLGEAIAAAVGRQGFSVPIRGPNGQFALFTVSDSRTDRDWELYTETHVRDLILVAHYVNQKALEIERGTDHVPVKSLSPREVDALTLLAMGYSRAQAAESLAISEHTLRVYIESARFKLGAANTTHAVARALTQGLLVV